MKNKRFSSLSLEKQKEIREKAVKAVLSGKSCSEVASLYNVTRQIVEQWEQEYHEGGLNALKTEPQGTSHHLSNDRQQVQSSLISTTSAINPLQVSLQKENTGTSFQQVGSEEEEEFNIFRYFDIILRRKAVILGVTFIITLLAFFKYINREKYYSAEAKMLFSPGHQEIMTDDKVSWNTWGDREKRINTHLELFTSNKEVLRRVCASFGNRVEPHQIRDGLTVEMGRKDKREETNIIELYYRNSDPVQARDVLNTYCSIYINYIQEVSAQDITRMLFKFESQIDKIDKELTEKEDALRRFKENNQMAQLSSETQIVISKLSEVELALQQTQLTLLENKEKLSAINSQISQQDINVVQSITYEEPYQKNLSNLQFELNNLLAEHGPDHYKIKMIHTKIEKMKEAIKANVTSKVVQSKTSVKNPIRESLLKNIVTLTIDKTALEAKRSAQQQIIEKLKAELLRLPSLEQQYASLERETESLTLSLKTLKQRYENLKIKRDSQESDLKILELAQTPSKTLSDVKPRSLIVGILIGLLLGIALAFLLEYMDRSIKDPKNIVRETGLPLVGIVPAIEKEAEIIKASEKKYSASIEPLRALRTNLKHTVAFDGTTKTIILNSAIKGEGKTTLAINIAAAFAIDGKKVILVDGDLRKPGVHRRLDLKKTNGLSDYILGSMDIETVIKPTNYKNFYVITAGECPKNPAELLDTPKFEEMIETLRGKADIVIFDSPALLPISDATIMASKMDYCLMVTRNLWSPIEAVKQAMYQLNQVGCNLFGFVFNDASNSLVYGYHYYYYGSYKYWYYDDDPRGKSSFRKIGLQTETKIKEILQGTAKGFYRRSAVAGTFLGYIGRKKLFWAFCLPLLILAVTYPLYKSSQQKLDEQGMKYLGNPDVVPVPASPGRAKDSSGIFLTRPIESYVLQPVATSYNSMMEEPTPEEPVPTISQANIFLALSKRLVGWQYALTRRNVSQCIDYYDDVSLEGPEDKFLDFPTYNRDSLFISTLQDKPITVDSSWIEPVKSAYCKVYTNVTISAPGKSSKVQLTQLWFNGGGIWRIIREKRHTLEK